ncbi:MAG: type II toxin-antitoxin system Phd/YefM family antitoxin [Pseudomonadota bacterium]
MQIVKASEFKAKCLALMDQVARSGQAVLVTKNGRPVAELHPHRPTTGVPFGAWADQVVITGDILSPIEADWDALK